MRPKRILAVAALLALSAPVTACGGGDGDGDGTSTGTSTGTGTGASASGLPQAKDMAAAVAYVSTYTTCAGLKPGDSYDNAHSGEENEAWSPESAAEEASYGIKERAVCEDASGHAITLLLTPDMRTFQAAAKNHHEKFAVGQDFAVVPVGDEAVQALSRSQLKFLSCDPDFTVPSGYTKEPASVDGCVLSTYFPS